METTDPSIKSEKVESLPEDDAQSKPERSTSPSIDAAVVDPSTPVTKSEEPVVAEFDYVTGFKLFAVIGVVTLACFLLLLDTSIIATVGPAQRPGSGSIQLTLERQFLESPVTSIHSVMSVGMVAVTYWQRT